MSAATLLCAASCKKDRGEAVGPVSGGESFTAVAECQSGDAKTGLVGLDVVWSAGDQIVVYDKNHNGAVFKLTEGAGTASGKFTKESDLGGNSAAFSMEASPFHAFYPSSVRYGSSGESYTISLPETQSYSTDGFPKDANPMGAYSESTSLQFHNLCGVMKLTMAGLGAVENVTVTGKGSEDKLSGTGTVTFDNANRPVLALDSNAGKSVTMECGGVRLNKEGVDFYVVLPANSFTSGFDVNVAFPRGDVFNQGAPGSGQVVNSIAAGRIREMPLFWAKGFPSEAEVPNTSFVGDTAARFTVSDKEYVYFSKGNLQYHPSKGEWWFADTQWDTLSGNGDVTSHYSEGYDGRIGLFGWGTSGNNHGAVAWQPWSLSTNGTDYWAYGSSSSNLDASDGSADWGYNGIANGGDTKQCWRTPTSAEWKYLIDSRPTTKVLHRYLKVKVAPKPAATKGGDGKAETDGINGLLVFPDGFTEWSLLPGDAKYDTGNDEFTTVVYSSKMSGSASNVKEDTEDAAFEKLEKEGVVFLPCLGYRPDNKVVSVGMVGYYWSSTTWDSLHSYFINFNKSEVNSTLTNVFHCRGLGVRLVCAKR